MKIIVKGIKWDTDGDNTVKLPKTITIKNIDYLCHDNIFDEMISDKITELTGFCHNGFEYEIIGDRQEKIIGQKKREIDFLHKQLAAFQKIADFLYEHKDCFSDDQQEEIDQLFDAL